MTTSQDFCPPQISIVLFYTTTVWQLLYLGVVIVSLGTISLYQPHSTQPHHHPHPTPNPIPPLAIQMRANKSILLNGALWPIYGYFAIYRFFISTVSTHVSYREISLDIIEDLT